MHQTVHVYILHPLFLWYSSSLGPLTFSNKPPHLLTHSLTAAVFFSHLIILLFIPYNEVSFHSEIFSGVDICRWLLTEQQALVGWGEDSTESFHSSSPLCPYGFNVAHLGKRGWGVAQFIKFLLLCFYFVSKWCYNYMLIKWPFLKIFQGIRKVESR